MVTDRFRAPREPAHAPDRIIGAGERRAVGVAGGGRPVLLIVGLADGLSLAIRGLSEQPAGVVLVAVGSPAIVGAAGDAVHVVVLVRFNDVAVGIGDAL